MRAGARARPGPSLVDWHVAIVDPLFVHPFAAESLFPRQRLACRARGRLTGGVLRDGLCCEADLHGNADDEETAKLSAAYRWHGWPRKSGKPTPRLDDGGDVTATRNPTSLSRLRVMRATAQGVTEAGRSRSVVLSLSKSELILAQERNVDVAVVTPALVVVFHTCAAAKPDLASLTARASRQALVGGPQ